ncbi:ROK family transcriptional regulator [Microbacterium sp. KUDC0406]|uniref:ROK family transcriptional regulator n=1 Tax=Microbacterium sp. KUDC0406 TaxID=2909588 RepID=UPI001F2199D1|nr:ROK family transcriptional regulator [Microbacterium sp. KUDC0406]UJP09833.1 ROK family transcriptional regulator [Microbacterium sp. KUDC0406]
MQQTQSTPGSQTSLREANRARVVSAVQQHGALTQVELAGITGLSAASVSNIVTELSESGVLDTSPSIRSGRRARLVTLARSIGLVAGIDVGARTMQVTLADASMQPLATETLPLAADHRADMTLQRAAMLIQELIESVGASDDELLAVAIGVPAPVHDGAVSSQSLLRGWDGAAVAEPLSAALRVPVVVDNDVNLGALAEARFGAAAGRDPVAYVHASHSIGAGLVVGGRVLAGRRGAAGEIGHVVVDEQGPVCRCGNRGCLETVAGSAPMLNMLRDSHGHLTLDDVVVRAIDGDAGCRRAIADTGRTLGTAVATLCNLFDPEVVVVGGRLADAGGVLLDPLRDAVERHTLRSTVGAPEVVASAFGGDAELRGAIAAALDRARELGVLGVPS